MVVDTKTEFGFPYWTSVLRRFGPDSSFFASGNIERELLAKQVLVSVPYVLLFLFFINMFEI